MVKDNRWCLICKPKNRTIYFHLDGKTGKPWLYCNKCAKGYSLENYCQIAGIELETLIQNGVTITKDQTNEVNVLPWPSNFVPMSDSRAEKGIAYVQSRGLSINADIYYDFEEEGIVFPYYFGNKFCGAQIRFIEPRIKEDGSEWKITTLSGTRLGCLFYGWNQDRFLPSVKGIIVVEGAFNAIAINQAFNHKYGSIVKNPWRAIATSGSGITQYQRESLKELKDQGYKIILAPDSDEAGRMMLDKCQKEQIHTHFAFCTDEDSSNDWNDFAKILGPDDFANFFIKRIVNDKFY
jgi:5S rRNA maturation endonuclease (ribonuclease M5)